MKLRSRLVVAFLLLSVLPLAAVTGYSYRSSLRAFDQAVHAESEQLAREMERRMDEVTAELGQRVDRLWEAPVAAAGAAGERPPARGARPGGQLAEILGDVATFLERIEFTPATPPPGDASPTPPTPDRPGAPSPETSRRGAGPPRRPAGPPAPIVVDLTSLIADAARNDPDARAAMERALGVLEDLQTTYGSLAELGMRGAALGLKIGAAELERLAAEHARRSPGAGDLPGRLTRRIWMRGGYLGMPVMRDGRTLGEVKAKLNLHEVLHTVLARSVRGTGENREIPFAIDDERRLYTLTAADRARIEALGLAGDPPRPTTKEPWVVVTRTDPRGVTFGIARPVGASLAEIRRAAVRNLGIGLSIVFVALLGIYPVSSHMTRHLAALTAGARAIARGRLDTRVPVRSRDELGELARAFNQMAEELAAHQALLLEQERLRRELELCREIQHEMLPREPLRVGVTEVRGVSIPAREVGGDFFNYFVLPGDRLALVVGDVSGKGISAALLMANIQATLRARLALESNLVAPADTLDREVEQSTPRGVFLTLFAGILDRDGRTLRYVNAGHNPQFVVRRGGEIERLPGTGLPIGLFAGHGYTECAVTLADGDLLFFYTDGIVEAENERGDYFGLDRLEALLVHAGDTGAEDLLARVERAVREFRGSAEAIDDATLMAVRVGNAPAA